MPTSLFSGNRGETLLGEKKGGTFCLHCRQPLRSECEVRSGFCCAGCHAAHDFIKTLGLDYFYELRDREISWSAKPVMRSSSEYDHFDDLNFAKVFIAEETARQSRMNFQLPGIHCAACVWLLEKLPEVVSGILQVRVDLMRGCAVVRFDPTTIAPSGVGKAFAMLGYKPCPSALDGTTSSAASGDSLFAVQLGVAAFAAMNVMVLFFARHQGYLTSMEHSYAKLIAWVSLMLSVPVVTFSALPFFRTSWASLKHRRLHIDLPIAIAILGGFVASAVNTILGREEIYFDTVTALVFLLLLGRWAQRFMMKRVGNATDLLHSLSPLSAIVVQEDGSRREVYIGSLAPGDVVVVADGEAFPCDGTIVAGESHVNNGLLTGESRLIPIKAGDFIFAGSKNAGSEVRVRASEIGKASRLGRLVEKIQTAPVRESKIGRFVDRISIYFVISVLLLAAFTFVFWFGSGFWMAWDRVISLLVVSCPCALGIATPITLGLAGMRAARRGILLKDGEALERLARAKEIIFDKTGTLTKGELGIEESCLVSSSVTWSQVWEIVEALEKDIEHPIAEMFLRLAADRGIAAKELKQREVIGGQGISGLDWDNRSVQIGSIPWLKKNGVHFSADAKFALQKLTGGLSTVVGVVRDHELVAIFALRDVMRPEAAEVVRNLNRRGLRCAIMSGDSKSVTQEVGRSLGLDTQQCLGEITPEEKSRFVEERGQRAVFVGDGANDGLALSRAGVGIGVKGGAEISLAVSDIFLLKPDLSLIVESIDGARETVSQIHRHLAISLFYNVIAATLAVTGYIGPLAAALVMPLSSFSVLASSVWRAPFRGGCP